MKLTIYQSSDSTIDAIEAFLDMYYHSKMRFFASDLLEKGLSPKQISDAVVKAMKVGTSSGIEIRKHFMPVFSQRNKELVKDCRLSKIAYGLVLMNADVELSLVGKWQLLVLEHYLK